MRGLSGDFNTMPLRDLVVYLGNRLATGTLVLEREGTRKQLVLEEGAIVNASSNHPREYLGQFLMNLGKVDDETLTRAFQTQKQTNVYLGRILVMTGAVKEEVVVNALSLKFRETILEAFFWPEGAFTFQPEVRPPQPDGLDVRVPLIEIHKESEFRTSAWEQIRTVFPHSHLTLNVNRANLAEPLAPGSIDARVLDAAEAGQTLAEMALNLHATDYFLFQRLYALHRLQVVTVAAERTEDELFDIDVDLGLGDSPSPEELLANALTLYEQNNLRDAWALARRSSQLAASHDASQLLRQLENAWHPDLALRMLGNPRVPRLVLPGDEARQLPVSAAERYLLSRIDGKRSLAGIIGVAPMREFEALVFIDRFVQAGWVSLD